MTVSNRPSKTESPAAESKNVNQRTPKNRAVRSRENTLERLVEAAGEVFADRGFAGATIDDLTTAAGFTRGAFYSNFSSKEEIFTAAVQHLVTRIVATTRAGSAEIVATGNVFAGVQAMFSALHEDLNRLQRIELEARLHALRQPDARSPYVQVREMLRSQVALILTESADLHNMEVVVDAGHLSDSLVALYFNAITTETLEGHDCSIALLGTTLVEACLQPRTEFTH